MPRDDKRETLPRPDIGIRVSLAYDMLH